MTGDVATDVLPRGDARAAAELDTECDELLTTHVQLTRPDGTRVRNVTNGLSQKFL